MTTRHFQAVIIGTDTDVGKSIVTGLLARQFIQNGWSTLTQKWVQSGQDTPGVRSEDLETHWQLMGSRPEHIDIHNLCPAAFPTPASPHLSAQKSQAQIDPQALIQATQRLQTQCDALLIEGSGGLLVPLTTKNTFLDIIQAQQIPVIIVAANKLGCINHTLLTVHALRSSACPILGIIMTQTEAGPKNDIQNDNPHIIQTLSHCPILGEIPYLDDPQNPDDSTQELLKEIWEKLIKEKSK